MREIKEIVIHCAATKLTQDIGAEDIKKWHVSGNGWQDIGYHYVIRLDGSIEKGRDIGIAGAHCRGHNFKSVGICLVGGLDENMNPCDNYTNHQYKALRQLLRFLVITFPGSAILGHRDVSGVRKTCPNFDVKGWYYG